MRSNRVRRLSGRGKKMVKERRMKRRKAISAKSRRQVVNTTIFGKERPKSQGNRLEDLSVHAGMNSRATSEKTRRQIIKAPTPCKRPPRPKTSQGFRREDRVRLNRRCAISAKTRRNVVPVWTRLSRPKSSSGLRKKQEPIVRPETRKWGIYPGQINTAGDDGKNSIRPPYGTHFLPGKPPKQKKRMKCGAAKKIRPKPRPKKKETETDLIVTAVSTSNSISVIPEGDSNDESDSGTDDDEVNFSKHTCRQPQRRSAALARSKTRGSEKTEKRSKGRFTARRAMANNLLNSYSIPRRRKPNAATDFAGICVTGINNSLNKNRYKQQLSDQMLQEAWQEYTSRSVSVAAMAAYEELFGVQDASGLETVPDSVLRRCAGLASAANASVADISSTHVPISPSVKM